MQKKIFGAIRSAVVFTLGAALKAPIGKLTNEACGGGGLWLATINR